LTTVNWPKYEGKLIGTVFRSSTWNMPLKIIADQTRSGKYTTRLAHIKRPKTFNIVMHMTLPEYRIFKDWFVRVCREGLYAFEYPIVDDNTGVMKAYQFDPNTDPSISNTGADNMEVSMVWMEAT
jgi:hypothetical protein